MKKCKAFSVLLAGLILCAMLPLQAFAAESETITVVLLGNHGTAIVSPDYSESAGLVWQQELSNGNRIGTDTITHISDPPFDSTNLKAGYLVTANEGYYIDAFYRSQADYDSKHSSLDDMNPETSLFQYKHGYLVSGILTELTWPGETFYISFKEIPEATLSLVLIGGNGTVTNNAGDYTTSRGIVWQQELSGGNKVGTDTLVLEREAPWGDPFDGMKAGYAVTAKDGFYIKALYPDQAAYDAKEPVSSENYSDIVKNADGYITACQWVWYAEPSATAYFEFAKLPDKNMAVKAEDSFTGVRLEATTGELPADTTLTVSQIKSGDAYASVNTILGDSVTGIVAYDISLKSGSTKIQPDGKVTVYLPIPDGFDKNRLTVYSVDMEKGTKESYAVTVETVAGKAYAVFETTHFSTYVLAEKAVSNPQTGDSSDLPLYAGLMLTSAGAVLLTIRRKKCAF